MTYASLGWPVERVGDRAWLRTGETVDLLEVGHAAGVLAVQWWRLTRGTPDAVRGLPPLPDPARSLAATPVRGGGFVFVGGAGGWPWPGTGDDPGAATRLGVPAVRWHGPGGRVPVPGGVEGWVCPPADGFRPVPAVALLELLTQAVSRVDTDGMLRYGATFVEPAAPVSAPERAVAPLAVPGCASGNGGRPVVGTGHGTGACGTAAPAGVDEGGDRA